MKQYRISVPVDYISGHLCYGHKEIVIETDKELTKEEALEMAQEARDWDLVVDDYSVEDYGDLDFDGLTFEEIK